jgi:hypothetical protein
MEVTSNLEEIIKRFERVAQEALTINVSDALIAGINASAKQMDHRIFNTGKDKNNESLGKYVGKKSKLTSRKFTFQNDEVPGDINLKKKLKAARKTIHKNAAASGEESFSEYEKLRLSKGRQIGYKDLEFFGSLRRAIITANEGNDKAVCSINNEFEALIAEYQEKQIGKIRGGDRVPIFGVNQTEIDTCVETTNGVLKQIYDNLFKT